MKKKTKPKDDVIAILTVKKDIAEMSNEEHKRLVNWLYNKYDEIDNMKSEFGKCRFRLIK